MHVGMNDCLRSESESASHSSPPQLKRVQVISTCVHARFRAGTVPLISLLCLFVCGRTPWHKKHSHKHTQATLKTKVNTCHVIMDHQHLQSSTVQRTISSNQPRQKSILTKATKARRKCPVAGPKTGCRTKQAPCIEEKQRVRQPPIRYTQQNKTKKNKYMHEQTHKYACWYAWLYEERQRIRVRPPAVRYTQKSKQTCMHSRVPVNVCVYEERERISVTLITTAAEACASDLWMCPHALVRAFTISHISLLCPVLSHEKHAHSLKRWKPKKNVPW